MGPGQQTDLGHPDMTIGQQPADTGADAAAWPSRTRCATSTSGARTVALTHPRTERCPSARNNPRRSTSATIATAAASAARTTRSTATSAAANSRSSPEPTNPSTQPLSSSANTSASTPRS